MICVKITFVYRFFRYPLVWGHRNSYSGFYPLPSKTSVQWFCQRWLIYYLMFQVDSGYPQSSAIRWLGCQTEAFANMLSNDTDQSNSKSSDMAEQGDVVYTGRGDPNISEFRAKPDTPSNEPNDNQHQHSGSSLPITGLWKLMSMLHVYVYINVICCYCYTCQLVTYC